MFKQLICNVNFHNCANTLYYTSNSIIFIVAICFTLKLSNTFLNYILLLLIDTILVLLVVVVGGYIYIIVNKDV